MTIEEFLANRPSRYEVAIQLCAIANGNILEIDDTFAWESLSRYGGFKKSDFYDDVQGTFNMYGAEALTHHGIVNWKLKEKLYAEPMSDDDLLINKRGVLSELTNELELASHRQKPSVTKDSGYMRGLRKAIEIIEGRYI